MTRTAEAFPERGPVTLSCLDLGDHAAAGTVKGYYRRFLDSLPDVRTLAEADEDTCLKLWEGLGYYSRARNLRLAAQEIVSRYEGRMPGTSAELKKLPGIGAYTAAAVASIAFGEKVPAIDGNLLRIFSRLTLYEEDVRKPAAMRSAERFYLEMMPEDRPGILTRPSWIWEQGSAHPGRTGVSG